MLRPHYLGPITHRPNWGTWVWNKSTLAGLLRKEVIQPHLPVQLPCYDFVPVTGPTLGRCLPCGLAHGLQALSASMT